MKGSLDRAHLPIRDLYAAARISEALLGSKTKCMVGYSFAASRGYAAQL